ncbi:hypothetical protein HDU96_008915 [Phlyctochytrium bullatum]|nr:hypothetical protein HDU96_008915 [Phlyctochytrium bullatum]
MSQDEADLLEARLKFRYPCNRVHTFAPSICTGSAVARFYKGDLHEEDNGQDQFDQGGYFHEEGDLHEEENGIDYFNQEGRFEDSVKKQA